MRIIIWRYGYVTGVHTSLVNSTRYKIDPIQCHIQCHDAQLSVVHIIRLYTGVEFMPQLSSYMQYYSMVRYFTHHSSLKGVKIQSLNLLYGVYIVCVPNNIHHWDHFDTHIVKGLAR